LDVLAPAGDEDVPFELIATDDTAAAPRADDLGLGALAWDDPPIMKDDVLARPSPREDD